jgi:hypothetical protein
LQPRMRPSFVPTHRHRIPQVCNLRHTPGISTRNAGVLSKPA